jgi:serine/threonine protein kinase
LAEAQKIAKLNHPNIVKIFRIGQLDNGLFYTVMELLPGETLKSFLKNKMQLMPRLKLWHDVYDALIFAHSKQIYHGDLHDGNIVVHEEKAKLIDFGTSIFAKKKLKNPLERESKKILEIVKRIFPEFDMLSVNEIINSNIKPEIILEIADAIVEINYSLLQLSRAIEANDHDRIWRELHSICINFDIDVHIHNYLFIKPEYIIKALRGIHIDEIYIGYFLDIFLTFISYKIEGNERRRVEPDSVTPIEEKLIHINKFIQDMKMTT